MRVVRAARGAERNGACEFLLRAARDVYVRAEREAKLHGEERDAAADARDEDVVSALDAGVHNRGPACVRAYVRTRMTRIYMWAFVSV